MSLTCGDLAHSVSPIVHVSDDVLYKIFYWIVSSTTFSGRRDNGSLSLVPVTHVCRYWRNLALASPHLWVFLHIHAATHHAMLLEFLGRSGDCPLLLDIRHLLAESKSSKSIDITEVARVLAEHTWRFRDVHISGFCTQVAKILLSFRSLAPQLQRLEIHAMSHDIRRPAFFMGWMPALRYVSLEALNIPWLPYRDMVELKISSVGATNFTDILATLRHSPMLENLLLQFHVPLTMPIDCHAPNTQTLHLDHLRSLNLGSYACSGDILYLLEHLSFPSTVPVELLFLDQPANRRSTTSVPECCSSIKDIAVKVESAHMMYTVWHYDRHVHKWEISLESTDSSLVARWSWVSTPGLFYDRVGLAMLPLPALRSLTLNVNCDLTDEWQYILQHLPNVENLEIKATHLGRCERSILSFFNALTHHRGAATHVACPKLSRLALSLASENDPQFWNKIAAALSTRALTDARMLDIFEVHSACSNLIGYLKQILGNKLKGVVEKVVVHGGRH